MMLGVLVKPLGGEHELDGAVEQPPTAHAELLAATAWTSLVQAAAATRRT